MVKHSEQRIAELVVAYLEASGADVYQEVAVSGGVADIVARVQAELWIVEVKTSLSLALLTQAMERRRLAHRVYVAAPQSKTIGDFGVLCQELGIGLLVVRPDAYSERSRVTELIESERFNRRPVELASKLRPEHKTHAKAGAIGGGGRWTPFRDTCEQLLSVVRETPGITVSEAVAKIRHHYSSDRCARSSLATWIGEGKVDGVSIDRDTRPATLHPADRYRCVKPSCARTYDRQPGSCFDCGSDVSQERKTAW